MSITFAVLDQLRLLGWRSRSSHAPQTGEGPLPQRYPEVDPLFLEFVRKADGLISPDETVWFLAPFDYTYTSELAFRWNEWELLSLDAARTDATWTAEIRGFWDRHLPFLLSVRGEYSYLALQFTLEGPPAVVFGFEPEFEEPTLIAPTFPTFLVLLERTLEGQDTNHELRTLFRSLLS